MISLTKTRLAIALLVAIAGTGGAAYATGVIQKPEYGLEDRGDWGEVENQSVEIVSSGWVYNPNPFKLNVSTLDIGYAVTMNGVKLARGGKKGLYIPSKNNTTIDVSTTLEPDKVPKWWVTHLRNDEESNLRVPINLQLKIFGYPITIDGVSYTDKIETDIESMMDSSVSKIKGNYSYQTVPETVLTPGAETTIQVKDASAKFGKIDSESTRLLIDLKLHNPNDYTIPTPQFNGELLMNQVEVADWQANEVSESTAGNAKIGAGETREVRFKVKIDNSKMDDWFVSHAANNERTDGRLNVRLGFDLFGQTVTLPPGGIRCDFSFQTAILEDNQKSSNDFEDCQKAVFDSDRESSGSSTDTDRNDSDSENQSTDDGFLDSSGIY